MGGLGFVGLCLFDFGGEDVEGEGDEFGGVGVEEGGGVLEAGGGAEEGGGGAGGVQADAGGGGFADEAGDLHDGIIFIVVVLRGEVGI